MRIYIEILKILTVLSVVKGLTAKHHKEEKCKFPRHWKGHWYQNGLRGFNIRSRAIDGKGHCEQIKGEYVLLKNKEANCYQCMMVIERHANIIQYRETFCTKQRSLKELCKQITVEDPIFTLVREPAVAVTCPLLDAYHFSYSTAQSPTCDKPKSYIKPCVGSEKLQLHFSHCDKQTPLHGVDLELECLAQWKDRSELFMYGKLSGPTIVSKEDSYRCFKYEIGYNNKWYMTMSLDSTCRGLFTARHGPFVMELYKDIEGWPVPQCEHPDWMRRRAWRDLDGDKILTLNGESNSLLVFEKSLQSQMLEMTANYRCVDVLKRKDDYWVMLAFHMSKCSAQFQCMKIKLLHQKVLILQFADLESRSQADQCVSGADYTHSMLILPNTDSTKPCPYPGIYPSLESCSDSLLIGCSNGTTLSHRTTCPGRQSVSVQCKMFWEDGDVTHIIGHSDNTPDRQLSCYTLSRQGQRLEMRSDPRCVLLESRHYSIADVSTFSPQSEYCHSTKGRAHENEVIKWKPQTSAPAQRRSHREDPDSPQTNLNHRGHGTSLNEDVVKNSDTGLHEDVMKARGTGVNEEVMIENSHNVNRGVAYKTLPQDVEYSSQYKGSYRQNQKDRQVPQQANAESSTSRGTKVPFPVFYYSISAGICVSLWYLVPRV